MANNWIQNVDWKSHKNVRAVLSLWLLLDLKKQIRLLCKDRAA